jgi:ribosome-associated protein
MTNYSQNHSTALTATNRATDTDDSYRLALTIAEAADDRKGGDIVLLKVAEVSYLADYFVVITGFSSAQVRAIARSIAEKVETEWQRQPKQAAAEGSWVLMDYGDVIVHVFLPQEREFYNLEAFWGHAERTSFAAAQLAKS